MERKTKVNAEAGKQAILITREFDLPLDLLFKAYVEPEIVEQWRSILGQLPDPIAQSLAWRNAERVYAGTR